MRFFASQDTGALALLLVVGTAVPIVSAATIKLPLRSAAVQKDGLGPRGTTKFQLDPTNKKKSSSGVNVPVTDWYNRTDNQVHTYSLSLSHTSM